MRALILPALIAAVSFGVAQAKDADPHADHAAKAPPAKADAKAKPAHGDMHCPMMAQMKGHAPATNAPDKPMMKCMQAKADEHDHKAQADKGH